MLIVTKIQKAFPKLTKQKYTIFVAIDLIKVFITVKLLYN